jgi:hypothetical protein
MSGQHRFDFAQLNPESANFNLSVHPSQKLDAEVRQISRPIPGPIKARARA